MNHWALLILGSLCLQWVGLAKELRPSTRTNTAAQSTAAQAATPDTGVLPSKFTDPKTLAPEESSGEIARLAARMIERSHFLRREFESPWIPRGCISPKPIMRSSLRIGISWMI
jgi:hypothetical protein